MLISMFSLSLVFSLPVVCAVRSIAGPAVSRGHKGRTEALARVVEIRAFSHINICL